jgi:hypothetical protein
MGPPALLPGFLSPLKIHRPRPGLNPRTLGPVASTLTTSPLVLYIPAIITVNNMVFWDMMPCGLVEFVLPMFCKNMPSSSSQYFFSCFGPHWPVLSLCPCILQWSSIFSFHTYFLNALAGSLPCPSSSHWLPCRAVSFSLSLYLTLSFPMQLTLLLPPSPPPPFLTALARSPSCLISYHWVALWSCVLFWREYVFKFGPV